MPGRKIPLINGETYHVVNRGISEQQIFLGQRYYLRALGTLFYYQNENVFPRYSFFNRLEAKKKEDLLKSLRKKSNFQVDIVAYCFMPTHIHLLLTQKVDKGISLFMSNFANSYTRYFNTKQKRKGPIFQGKFNAVRIETNDQILHVSRYIHLNPYTSYVVKSLSQLKEYPYSSLPEYLNPKLKNRCQKDIVLEQFKNNMDYSQFVFDQADYQRQLEWNKHLLLD